MPLKPGPGDLPGVLYIIDQLCALGGAERVLLRMLEHLPREKYSPRVVTFQIDPRLGFETLLPCPLHVYPLRRTCGWTALGVAQKIRQLIRSQNIRITHTFHETSDLWAGIIARMSRCPILISSRRDMGFLRTTKHQIAYRWFGRNFDEVQTVSEEVRRFCITNDQLDPRRVVTIHNGIDLPSSASTGPQAARARFGLEQAGQLVVSVGNIRRIKGFDVFIRAAARAHAVMPHLTFAIAGAEHDTAYAAELRTLAASLGLGSTLVFLGDVKDIQCLLRAADVFCLLSRSEGLSNALLEAMACELPCVATRVGGNPEVVLDGTTGHLVDSDDAESAAAAILRLLQHPAAAKRMGCEGRRVIEKQFTTGTMMRMVVSSYDRLLDSTSFKRF